MPHSTQVNLFRQLADKLTQMNACFELKLALWFATPTEPKYLTVKAIKRVDLVQIPKVNDSFEDGPLKLFARQVSESLSGPNFIVSVSNNSPQVRYAWPYDEEEVRQAQSKIYLYNYNIYLLALRQGWSFDYNYDLPTQLS